MFEDMYNGTIYEDEDKAREVAKEEMDLDDYLEFGDFSLKKLLKLAWKYCPDEIFDEMTEAEERYFDNRFCEVEEEEQMRIEKGEMIFLSQKEADTWTKFSQILEGIERESENPYILDLISEITGNMSDLWEEVEGIE